jgi:hypothetical protein
MHIYMNEEDNYILFSCFNMESKLPYYLFLFTLKCISTLQLQASHMSLFLALLSKQQNYEIYTLVLPQAYNHLKDSRHAYLYKFCKVLTICQNLS